MIIQHLLNYLGTRILDNSSVTNKPIYMSIVFLFYLISVVIIEAYLSLSLFLYFTEIKNIVSFKASLLTSAAFLLQLVILHFLKKFLSKKFDKPNVIVQEYKILKNALNDFVDGFNKG
jgi:hypothetical protein